jgi:uncharacterized protein YdgA (DUF945 family)
MKKIVITVLVLGLLLVAAPWGIGKLAETRVNSGLDQVVKEAPYLTIVERKWTRGWFRSEQEVTFEIMGPWVRALNPATILADIKKAEAAQSETPAEEKPMEPLRFTIRNEILHGPVLWPASLGVARVNTRLVMSEEVRKKIMEVFGTDEPVRMSTRVSFFGGGTTRLYGDGQTIKLKDGDGTVSYDDYYLDMAYSSHLDKFDMDGSWPSLEVKGLKEGGRFTLSKARLEYDSTRILGDIYDADARFTIGEVRIVDAANAETLVEDAHYIVDTEKKGDFIDLAAKFGTGKVKSKQLESIGLALDEVHYDLTFAHLHIKTLQDMMTAMRAAYEKPMTTKEEIDAAIFGPFKQYGTELLKYDPEFAIDRIGIVTPEGEALIKGVVKLKGATAADFSGEAMMGLIGKVDADFNVSITQKLLEKIPGGATGIGASIDAGYAKRDGDKVVSHIEFRNGELKINGKAQALPGMGGPPPGAETPPQE